MVKRKKKKKAQLPFRINILFFAVFLLFSMLILQLGVVQILQGQDFQDEIDRTIQDTTSIPVPRGKIYDNNYNLIVDNKPLYSITYTPAKGTQAEDRLEVAEDLAKLISMDSEDDLNGITERDMREYWYIKDEDNKEKADERFKNLDDEQLEELDIDDVNEISNAEAYRATLELITEEEYEDVTEDELEIIAIKKELDKAYSLTPQIIKNEDVSPEEYARVAENLDQLPGVNATTDWDREYPYENTLSSLLGSVTSQEQGIPGDKEQHYLTRGYARNDRVGSNGLEEYYEDLLRGRKEQIQYTTTTDGTVVGSETVVEGERGKDLVLTIDMEFQEEVDNIVREKLETAHNEYPYENRFMTDAMAVVINPQTGELLAVSGQTYDRDEGESSNSELNALYNAHEPGSSIKGATVLAGYESGVISPGQTFHDSTINIAGTESKGSYTDLGPVNDYSALSRSSNVYMFYIALKMGGEHRYPFPEGSTASFDTSAFQEMRNYFQQFGLGSSTGIDFPHESTGLEGAVRGDPGLLMDNAIGQYDTFTTMQLAQYVSTIANDGYRVRPHFLKEVRNPVASDNELGSVYRSVNTDVMNRIQMDQSEIERVQEGFRRVFQSSEGTGSNYWMDKDYNPAGKTGTAETEYYYDGEKLADTNNLSLVGYAPFDDPEVAFAVVIPHTGTGSSPSINHEIGTRILDAYFDMKEDSDGDDQGESDDED